MTLSNNAIKFLMAQYRAIFKHAYLKGLAPAILLTTGLAAGQAQAAAFDWATVPSGDTFTNLVTNGHTESLTENVEKLQAKDKVYVVSGDAGPAETMHAIAYSQGDKTLSNEAIIYRTVTSGTSQGLLAIDGDVENNGQIYYRTSGASAWSSFALFNNGANNKITNNGTLDVLNAMGMGFESNSSGVLTNATDAVIYATASGEKGGAVGMDMSNVGLTSADNAIENYGTIHADGNLAFGIRVADGTTNGSVYNNGTISATSGAVSIAVLDGNEDNDYATTSNIKVILESGSQIDSLVVSDANSVTFRNNQDKLLFGTVDESQDNAIEAASTLTLINSQITFNKIESTDTADTQAEEGDASTFPDSATLSEINLDATSLLTNNGKIIYTGSNLNVTDEQFDGLTQGNLTISGAATINVDGDQVWDLTAGESGLGTIAADGSLATESGNFIIDTTENVTFKAGGVQLGSAYKAGNLALDVGTLNVAASAKDKNRFTFSSGSITVHDKLNGAAAADRFVIRAENKGDSAYLHLDATNGTGTITNIDRFNVGFTSKSNGTSTLEVDGTWDFGAARISASKNGKVQIDGTAKNVSELMLEQNGQVTVNGDMTIERLLAGQKNSSGSKLDINGILTITGDNDKKDDLGEKNFYNDVQLTQTNVTINNGGCLTISGKDAVEDIFTITESGGKVTDVTVSASGGNTTEKGGWVKDKVTLKAGATLEIDLAATGLESISTEDLKTLKGSLVKEGYQGSFDFGQGITIELGQDLSDAISGGSVSYDQLVAANVNDVQNVAEGVTVTVDSGTAASGIKLSTNSERVQLSGTDSVTVSGSLILTNTAGTEFVQGATKTGDVSVAEDSAVNLTGNATVGNLTKADQATGTSAYLASENGILTTGDINLDKVTVASGEVKTGDVTATDLTLNGSLTNATDQGQSVTAETLTQNAGTLTTNTLTLGSSGSTDTNSTVAGNVTADSIVIQSGSGSNTLAVQGGTITAGSLKLNGEKLAIGSYDAETGEGTTGVVEVDSLELGGGMIVIDPSFDESASLLVVTGTNSSGADVLGSINGDIGVGQNAIAVLGAEKAEALAALHGLGILTSNDALSETGIGSVLYMNDTLKLDSGSTIVLDKTGTKDSLSAGFGTTGTYSGSTAVVLNSGTALVVSSELSDELATNNNQALFTSGTGTAAITFTGNEGSEIIFNSTNLNASSTITLVSGGANSGNTLDSTISAASGLLTGELAQSGDQITVDFNLAEDAEAYLYNQSSPVKDLTLDVFADADPNNPYDTDARGVSFILSNHANGGKAIESAARLASYAGAVQATLMAQQTSTDAVAERLGANPNSSLVASNNVQGGGLWLAPVYKNHDSDGFDAQGVDYGADIDLYGAALGADVITASGVRVGGYFNFGTGEADGQGVGSDVSNDFDYFGLGIYAGMTLGNFGLIADIGFTQVSNDVEQSGANGGFGKLTADTDTSTYTVGLRGEYKLTTAYVDVTPHLGLRYTNFDMDGYDVMSTQGSVVSTSAESMNIFAIPFGVSFSKDIALGAWSVKPVFDVTLTANAGDTEFDSTSTFFGAGNVVLSTEVLDDFTYGGSLGIDAQFKEAFSFGLNVGYTGSSNADEFGVNANARYTF